jgi:hypothetical protein
MPSAEAPAGLNSKSRAFVAAIRMPKPSTEE